MNITTQNYPKYREAFQSTIDESVENKEEELTDQFKKIRDQIIEEHKLNAENIKKEDDFRNMSEKEWDKFLEHFDQYIDEHREQLQKKIEAQEEAARKAMAQAPAGQKVLAARRAMLAVAANGVECAPFEEDSQTEKSSWTYQMTTENQTILAKAKMANRFAADMLDQANELASKEVVDAEVCDAAILSERKRAEEQKEQMKKEQMAKEKTEKEQITEEQIRALIKEV